MKHYLWVRKTGDFGGVLTHAGGFPPEVDPTDIQVVCKRDALKAKRAQNSRQRELLDVGVNDAGHAALLAADVHRIADSEVTKAEAEPLSGDADKSHLAFRGKRLKGLRETRESAKASHAEAAALLNTLRTEVANLDRSDRENTRQLDLAQIAVHHQESFATGKTAPTDFDSFFAYECPCPSAVLNCSCAGDRHVDSYVHEGVLTPKATATLLIDGGEYYGNSEVSPFDFKPLSKLRARIKADAPDHDVLVKPLSGGASVMKDGSTMVKLKKGEADLAFVVPPHGLSGGVSFWTPRIRFVKFVFRGWED